MKTQTQIKFLLLFFSLLFSVGQAEAASCGTQTVRVYTNSLTPSGYYLGTYDDYRGGGFFGRSTDQAIADICALAGMSGSTSNYACAPSHSTNQSRHNGDWLGFISWINTCSWNGWTQVCKWGWSDPAYAGQGWCTDGGVAWVNCLQDKPCPPPPPPVNGSCGSANGQAYSSAPASGLCNSGNFSGFFTSNPWSWACYGANGGSTAPCGTAQMPACGSVKGTCQTGASSGILSGSGSLISPWFWTCSNAGASVGCAASAPATNGSCGTSNGQTFPSKPTTNLCADGSTPTVSGSGPWTWTCSGTNGGTNASCSALAQPINGSCGSSNGQTLASAPTTNLCADNSTPAVSGSGPWTWTCNGANGGTNASCSASKLCIPNWDPSTFSCSQTPADCASAGCGVAVQTTGLCNATDLNHCGQFPTQQNCRDHGVQCSNAQVQCQACVNAGNWKEVAP